MQYYRFPSLGNDKDDYKNPHLSLKTVYFNFYHLDFKEIVQHSEHMLKLLNCKHYYLIFITVS